MTSPPRAHRRRIALIALDLDGTIVDAQMRIPERVRSAVGRAMERGIHVTLATGRIYEGARLFAEQLGIKGPLICVQGGVVRHAVSGETLVQRPVPVALAREVIETTLAHGWDLCVYIGDVPYVAKVTRYLEDYAAYTPVREQLRAVGDLRAWLTADPLKLLLASSADECTKADRLLREQFAGRLQVVRSFATFVEATSLEATKGRALAFVAEYLGIPQQETMAIGDNDNDLDMITWAGLGVAMGNASPAVKAAADTVCPSFELDGAAVAIERWALGENRDA